MDGGVVGSLVFGAFVARVLFFVAGGVARVGFAFAVLFFASGSGVSAAASAIDARFTFSSSSSLLSSSSDTRSAADTVRRAGVRRVRWGRLETRAGVDEEDDRTGASSSLARSDRSESSESLDESASEEE